MLCPACKNFRPANNTPCPWCNAPAAQAGNAWGEQNGSFAPNQGNANSWGGPAMPGNDGRIASGQLPFGGSSWQDPMGSGAQQMGFGSGAQQNPFGSNAQQMPFAGSGVQQMPFGGSGAQPAASDSAFWSQNLGTGDGQGSQAGKQMSLVPYEPPASFNAQALMPMPNGFPTLSPNVRAVNSLLPALPDQEEPVYIPPLYTKPRPIIPRYRAVSGMLSVLIVFTLLCGGAGYFAQVTGKLTPLEKFLGFYNAPAMTTGQQALPVPSTEQTPGPANNIVYSVGLGTSVDKNSGQVTTYVNQFTVEQTIHIVCSLNITAPGTLKVKWYTNNNYDTSSVQTTPPNKTGSYTAGFTIAFATPAQVRADVYWNDKLADTLFLVVEPSAQ